MGLDVYAAKQGPNGDLVLAPKKPFEGIALGIGPAPNELANTLLGKILDGLVTSLTGVSLF